MHPDTDELFYMIEGEFEVTIIEDAGPTWYRAKTGATCVVPPGLWHKPSALSASKVLYLTPGQSLHSDAEGPRTA